MTLTDRQSQALAALRTLTSSLGRPPSYEALGHAMGCGKTTAYGLVRRLETKGFVRRELIVPKRARCCDRPVVSRLLVEGAVA